MVVCMRTTINLPDALGEAAKRRAARDGRTLTSLVEEGLRRVLADEPQPEARELPAHGDPGGRFLVDPSDRDALWSVLDGDGLR